jgi:hypothetical protein
LDNHGVGPPAIFVLETIISHFATFMPQMQKKFHEQFVIIRSKQGERLIDAQKLHQIFVHIDYLRPNHRITKKGENL